MKLTPTRLLLMILTAVFLWLWAPWSEDRPAREAEDEITSEEEIAPEEDPAAVAAEATRAPSAPAVPAPEAAPTGPVLTPQNVWQEMDLCLELGVSPIDSQGTVDSWTAGLRSTLGEPVLQTEDWSEVELRTTGGERRRLHVGMDYSGDDRIVRRLSYDKILADGSREAIPVQPEQAIDPSDTILATLESDGQVVNRQRFQRIYFENGEEILVREQNGQVADLELNRGGRQFKCTGIGAQGRCDCVRNSDTPPGAESMPDFAPPDVGP